jgi:diketogulonate reductase-like aldo/keto reductase
MAALAVGGSLQGQSNDPLPLATIPSSGEGIPRLGLGTWQTFDVGQDARRRADLAETLRVFTAAGGRVVDSSPMYGTSEAVVGDLVEAARLRDRLWLATKVWTTGARAGEQQMNTSLERLRSPRIELMQVHNLVDWRTHLRTLRAWKERGTIRYIGVTHYTASSHGELERVLRSERVDFLQLNLSLDEPEAAERMLALCTDRGVAFIANRPFGGGASFRRALGKPLPAWAAELGVTSWAQFMLKWVLSFDAVTCAIPGTGNPRHMADNLGGARGRLPDAAMRQRMAQAWRAL